MSEEMNADNKGLHGKYRVYKKGSRDLIRDCFVLRPAKDIHAKVALQAYAESCKDENPELAHELNMFAFHGYRGGE